MLGAEWKDVRLGRTKGKKPFVLVPSGRPSHCGNFNYSVAHDVSWGKGQKWCVPGFTCHKLEELVTLSLTGSKDSSNL